MKTPINHVRSVHSPSAFRRDFRLAPVLAAGLLAATLSAQAATTYNWINTTEADYATPGAWSPSGPPGSLDTAVIGNATLANGVVAFGASDNYTLTMLQLGNVAGTAAFNMNGGTFTINKSGTDGFKLGGANGANATFTLNHGNFSVIRPTTLYQDCVSPGNAAGSAGTIVINNGTAVFQCGVEIGYNGVGTITINGGYVYCSGWFNAGRGANGGSASTAQGCGIFNLNGGTLFLQQTNSGIGGTSKALYVQQTATNGTANISGGTLICEGIRVMNANSLASGGINPTATLNVSGGDLFIGANGIWKPGTLAGGIATVNLSGGTFHTTNSLTPGGDADWAWNANLPANLNTSPGSGNVTFAPGIDRTITLSNVFSGAGGITLAGPGTLAVNGANGYSGDTVVNGGTLSGFGSLSGSLKVNSGGTLAPGSLSVPAAFSAGSLTLNGGTVALKLSANADSGNDQLISQSDVTFQSQTAIKVVPTGSLAEGIPYILVTYSGSLVNWDTSKLSVISDSPRYSFTILDPATTPGSIQVVVSGNAASLTWRGTDALHPADWDHATANWFNNGTSLLDSFFNGDLTTFDDSATTTTLNLVDGLQPSAVVMANATKPITFTGSGLLTTALGMVGGAPLTLAMSTAPVLTGITNNAGALVFNLANSGVNSVMGPVVDDGMGQGTIIQGGANTLVLSADSSAYWGTLKVTNGVLRYAVSTALGPESNPLYVTNNGTLDFDHINVGNKQIVISGPGFNGQGAVTDSNPAASSAHAVVSTLTLAADAAIGSQGRWDMSGGGGVNGNGFHLTKVGNGFIALDGGWDSGLGDIEVTAGRLAFQHNCTPGDSSKTLTVDSGATVTFYALAAPATKYMSLKHNGTVDSGGGANTFAGQVTLQGTNNFATRSHLYLSGAVVGSGALAESTNGPAGNGTGILYLEGANTYTGATLVGPNSTIALGASATLANSSPIILNSGSTLDVSAQPVFTFNNGQYLTGVGTLKGGTINIGSGATLAVGVSGSAGTLTVNNDLVFLAGSTNIMRVNGSNGDCDLITGLSSVTYGGTLVLTFSAAPTAARTFKLFHASSYGSTPFANVVLPAPGAGYAWDTSGLTVDGTVMIVASVPPQFGTTTPLPDGNVQFTATGAANAGYTLWFSSTLAPPAWTALSASSGSFLGDGTATIQDLTATNHTQGFYRLSTP